MDRPTQRKTALLAVSFLIVLGLAVSELVVRLLMPYNTPDTLRKYSLAYERAPFTRSRLARMNRLVDADAAKAWGTKPADAPSGRTFHINDLGFRGPSFAPRKPAGTTRVFVLGGSAVFDQNVSDTEAAVGRSWPNRAQTLLKARGFDIEVINAGTPGHSSVGALGRLIAEIWLYEPDVVLLYSGWNDVKKLPGDGDWSRDAAVAYDSSLRPDGRSVPELPRYLGPTPGNVAAVCEVPEPVPAMDDCHRRGRDAALGRGGLDLRRVRPAPVRTESEELRGYRTQHGSASGARHGSYAGAQLGPRG